MDIEESTPKFYEDMNLYFSFRGKKDLSLWLNVDLRIVKEEIQFSKQKSMKK